MFFSIFVESSILMAKQKKTDKNAVISGYMDYVLEHGEHPKSVYSFVKQIKITEAEFYNFFGNFEILEREIFDTFFSNTISVLEKSKDYKTFDARNKMLSFYFLFFENLTANRSYVLHVLAPLKDRLKALQQLKGLRQHFKAFVADLNIEKLRIESDRLNKLQDQTIEETAWIQLLLTLKFWMDDSSPNFEKTDIFIEKAVNTSFDLINIAPVKSLIDFGKFIFKERVKL